MFEAEKRFSHEGRRRIWDSAMMRGAWQVSESRATQGSNCAYSDVENRKKGEVSVKAAADCRPRSSADKKEGRMAWKPFS